MTIQNQRMMAKKFEIRNSTAEFLIFMAEGKEDGVQVMYAEETIWCTQDAIATLFEKSRSTIAEHLSNIFKEGELDKNSVCRNFRRTATDGKSYNTQFYNLDAIISVGYRANSRRATQFRQWCTYVLRQYAIRGYVIDKKRMENGSFIGVDYFEQLLEEIREIIYPKGNAVRSLLSWIRYKLLDCVFFQKGIATIHVAQRRQLQKLQPSWTADIAIYHNFKKQ